MSSYTFGLIGVNEAGKSSILKAISLKDNSTLLTPKDFNNKNKNIEILFKYKLEASDDTEGFSKIISGETTSTILTTHIFQPDEVVGFKLTFPYASPSIPSYDFLYSYKKNDFANTAHATKVFLRKYIAQFFGLQETST